MYKVVLIDDEPVILQGMARGMNWERWNARVAGTAMNGNEGRDLINTVHPDIVFTDISMPNMDGLTMLAGLKSEHPNIQVAILTGFRNFEYAQSAIRLGVSRFISKPSKMDELEEAMEHMIAALRESGNFGEEADADESAENDAKNDTENDAKNDASSGDCQSVDSPASNFIVKNAMTYIEEHFMEKLKLSDVAEHVYVSQWHLSKLINRQAGLGFSDILNNKRIEKAKELLKDPMLRIGDIADQVGFMDIAHFSRVFKKVTGVSANTYRNTKIDD